MHYKNAKDCLPEELLKEVQKYADGVMLYIPINSEKAPWGTISGYRDEIAQRNKNIAKGYRQGESVAELSARFFLSEDSIRKIISKESRETTKQNDNTDGEARN